MKKLIKKTSKLLILTLLISLFTNLNQAQAASFNLTAKEDAYYKEYINLNRPSVDLNINRDHKELFMGINFVPDNDQSYKKNTILKFDLNDNASLMSALQNESVVSVTLNMFQWRYRRIGDVSPNYNVFQVDNNWSETSDSISTPIFDSNNSIGQMTVRTGVAYPYEWITSQLDIDTIKRNNDNVYSIVISYMSEDLQNQYASECAFRSKDYGNGQYGPYVTIETAPTPAPEPTSMLLGLMGVAGAARLRRKK